MMRALVIAEPGRADLTTVPRPDAGPDEVLIRLEGCGVCGSELPAFQGRDWFKYPLDPGAPGHEGWGVVAEIGESVSGVARGDRVAVLSYRAHAEYDIASKDGVVKLPESIGDAPFPGEALSCAINAFRRAEVGPEHSVAIVGVGFLGALITQLCSRVAAHVVAISRREHSRAVAREMGADEVFPLDDAVVEKVQKSTGGALFDRVVECTGVQRALDVAGELTGIRGRLVVAGYHQDGVRTVNLQLWNWRGIDVINAHERDPKIYVSGMREACRLVEAGEIDTAPLYTHVFPLDRAGDAFRAALDRPAGFMKAVICS